MKKKFYRQQYTFQDIKDYIKNNNIKEYILYKSPIYFELEYKKKK